MRDLPRTLWIGLPLASFIFCVSVAVVGGEETYLHVIRASDRSPHQGYLEHSTVVMLLPAIGLSAWMFVRRRGFPKRFIAVWCVLLFLGSLYYAGEECSWGQHYFHWASPDWIAQVSDQGETNIHNVSGLFDQVPRGLLTLGAAIAVFAPPLIVRYRKGWYEGSDWRGWLLPTMASLPAGLLVLLVSLPRKICQRSNYLPRAEGMPEWFDSMFLRGHHSELKEHFIAMFILIYVCSMAYRYRAFRKSVGTTADLP